jgi:hypothetical protein
MMGVESLYCVLSRKELLVAVLSAAKCVSSTWGVFSLS